MTRRLVKIASRLAALCIFALTAFGVVLVALIPRVTHGTSMTVLTGSMTPTIPVGSLVVVVPVDPGTLKVGDIATYQAVPGRRDYITHRVIGINTKTTPTLFTFKGDANRGPDINPVPASAIRGRVLLHVPYVGAMRDLIHTKRGVVGFTAVLLVGYCLSQLCAGLRERKSAGVRPGTDDVAELVEADSPATVIGVVPDAALRRLSHQQARVILRSRLVGAEDGTYTVAIDIEASDVADAVRTLDELGGSEVEVRNYPSDEARTLDRLRTGSRARTLVTAGSDA